MKGTLSRVLLGLLAASSFSATAWAIPIPFGYLSYDVTIPGVAAQFNITNQTGPNSTPVADPTWPVATTVQLVITSLTVDFNDGSTTVFGPSDFMPASDGFSWLGSSMDISGTNRQPVHAILAGSFDNSLITLNDGTSLFLPSLSFSNFTHTGNPQLTDSFGRCSTGLTGCLQDGDLDVIYAQANASTVPEPATCFLLGMGILGLLLLRGRAPNARRDNPEAKVLCAGPDLMLLKKKSPSPTRSGGSK